MGAKGCWGETGTCNTCMKYGNLGGQMVDGEHVWDVRETIPTHMYHTYIDYANPKIR